MSRGRVLVALMIGACSRSPKSPTPAEKVAPIPIDAGTVSQVTGDLRAREIGFRYWIHYAPEPSSPVEAALATCRKQATTLKDATITKTADEPPPDIDLMTYFARDIPQTQLEAIARSSIAVRLEFQAPGADAVKQLRQSVDMALCLAHETGGLIWDDETRELFSEKAWREARVDAWEGDTPRLLRHATVHSYQNGELVRSVSLGMKKLGLPELVVSQHAHGAAPMPLLLLAAGQALWARGTLGPGGTLEVTSVSVLPPEEAAELAKKKTPGKATLTLVEGKREEGDADNRLLEIRFAGPEEQIATLDELFGIEDAVYGATDDDKELTAARDRAMKQLRALRPTFAKEMPEMSHLSVKAPFTTDDGGVEWMWVEVLSWKGDDLEGLLMNEPMGVASLKQGARVRVKLDSLFDYIYEHGKTKEGGETTEILMRRQRKMR